MEALRTLSTLLPLALTSGINLYATLLIVGLSIRFGWVAQIPAGMEAIGSWPVIIVAGVFYIVEFLADKIPVVDNISDMIHTFIRPLGAALVSFAVVSQMDPMVAVLAALAAGGIALVSHSSKAGSRMVVNVTSPAENVTNVIISLAEDIGVGLLAFTALKFPYLAVGIAVAILILMILLMPRLFSWGWFNFRAIWASFKSAFVMIEDPEVLPASHLTALSHRIPDLSTRCQVQGIRSANGRSGYLCLSQDELAFTYNTLAGARVWKLPISQIVAVYQRNRFFSDVLEVHYHEGKKERNARFVFLKDRAPLVEQTAARLSARPVQ